MRSSGWALSLTLLATVACTQPTTRLEVYTWWEKDSETLAFQEVVRIHRDIHPDVVVSAPPDDSANNLRRDMAKRLLAGAPLATFQANIGADVLRWTVVDTSPRPVPGAPPPLPLDVESSTSLIRNLSGVFERSGLSRRLPQALLNELTLGGDATPYAVPLNIHRLNTLYYHQAALDRFGALPGGTTFLDLATLCPENPDTPALELVIAVGTLEPWTLVLLTFENVLPALTSAQFYDDLFRGRGRMHGEREPGTGFSPEVRDALECVQYLSQSFHPDHTRMDWAAAVRAVENDQAAFTVMGDWTGGLLGDALGNTVMGVPFPGSEGTFVFTSDTFPVPKRTEHPVEVEQLLETFASRKAQLAFSAEKGSIPARNDVVASMLNPAQARAFADFRDAAETGAQVVATSGLFPPYYPQTDLEAALRDMIAPGAGDAAINEVLRVFTDAEPLLALWQARLEAGVTTP